jgi:hypothetical protein
VGHGFNDIYVLSPERSFQAARKFLDTLMPQREQSADEYLFPEYSENPIASFHDADLAIEYGMSHPNEACRFYFRNEKSGEPAHAMVFLTSDGGMVLGVSIGALQGDRRPESGEVLEWLERLRISTGAAFGYGLHESPPPCETVREFLAGLELAVPPKLVAGQLHPPQCDEDCGVVWLNWQSSGK